MYKILDIMKPFFDEPYRWFGVREFGKLINVTPSTSSKYLENCMKNNLLEGKQERNLKLYRSKTTDNYKDLKKLYNLSRLRESGLIKKLIEEFNFPEAIVLFGSYSKAENHEQSDIDIFVLSESKKELDLSKIEKKLKAKVQLFVYSRKNFELMKTKNKELLNNILNGDLIYGFLEVFK